MAPTNESNGLTSGAAHDISPSHSNNVFSLSEGKLTVNGVTLLSGVPANVSFTPFSTLFSSSDAPAEIVASVKSKSNKGGFLGFTQQNPSDRLVNSLGKFIAREFVSIFRFKTWWSTMWTGTSGSDIQMETQLILLNIPEIKCYALILPIIEGSFRSALHPGKDGEILIAAESGSSDVVTSSFNSIAYLHVCSDPYTLMKEAYSAARVFLNTFRLLEEKSVPRLVDKFGWCTWDAFYLTVEPVGVWHGIKDFVEGGVSPRFLIVDDGWQSINFDGQDPKQDAKNLVLGGTQMTGRLYRFEECDKFGKYKAGIMLGPNAPAFNPNRSKMLINKAIEIEQAEKALEKAKLSGATDLSSLESKIAQLKKELDDMFGGEEEQTHSSANHGCKSCNCDKSEEAGFKAFTKDLRTKFKGLDDIYVWQALCGAWGGVRPGTAHLNSKVIPVKVSPGLAGTMTDLAVVKIEEGRIGLVHPDQASEFYDSMHSYLSKVGITGVKVDVIHTLEYVSEDYGGRVELAKAYYKGLTDSLIKNFRGTGLISSMQQCNDFFFLGTRQISIGRVGDDFWFQDPNGDPMGMYWLQGVHMIHCAYNSMWMGQIIHPDWDMFQSDHVCAKFHAGSRAICGGPIYVSDSVGGHDFDLIKKLVFPDGTIPKCQQFALPAKDCLFRNPLFDGETILKIWNFNKFGGVIGAFNCQGAGWDPKEQRIKGFSNCYKPVSGSIHVSDVEWSHNKASPEMGAAEEFAVYLNQGEELLLMTPTSNPSKITIQPSSFEIFSFVPITKFGSNVKFAPIGLTNMFNSGGTITDLEFNKNSRNEFEAKIKVKGGGKFLAYSSEKPKKSSLNGGYVENVLMDGGKLTVELPWDEANAGISELVFVY